MAAQCAASCAKCRTALQIDRVERRVLPRERIQRSLMEALLREIDLQRPSELAHRRDRVRAGVSGMDLEPAAQKIDEIAPFAAAGVEDAGTAIESAAQQLIEQIDVEPAEFGLQVR